MVITEAMQYGLPVISFDLPSSNEIFGDSNCGFLVDCYDEKKYANAMLEIASNDNILHEMSLKAIEQSKKFDIDVITNRWISEVFNRGE